MGSLLAAAASFIDARQSGGQWLLRIEDIDPPREVHGAADRILRQLESVGLVWDGSVLYQSTRLETYRDIARELLRKGLAFHCSCSRADIRQHAEPGRAINRYPGTCRGGPTQTGPTAARVLTDASPIRFDDRLQGPQEQDISAAGGDYVIQRRDGLPAYHLAVVVDDHAQGITDVVRGNDLLASTFVHCHLQRILGFHSPRYAHIPILVNARGDKLSKQTGAVPLELANPSQVVSQVLKYLGHEPPADLQGESPELIWHWAIAAVRLPSLFGGTTVQLP
jgi:glutamyl-Q tRNA(Asp) synthetase